MSNDFLYGFRSVFVPLPPRIVHEPKTIEPNHVELALYAASVECASARGVAVSRVRVLSPTIHPMTRRFFDGSRWREMTSEETFHRGLVPPSIRSYIVTEHCDLDLVSWLHLDTVDEAKETLGEESPVLLRTKATEHKWSRLKSYVPFDMTKVRPADTRPTQSVDIGEGCLRCLLLKPGLHNFHAWIAADPTCQYCGEEWTGKNEGQVCKGFAPLPACEYRLEPSDR